MFLFAALLLAIASFLDGLSTVYMLRRGGWELNPIFGHYPSKLRLFSRGGAIIATEIAVLFFLRQFIPNSVIVVLCVQAVIHFYAAAGNYFHFRRFPVVR